MRRLRGICRFVKVWLIILPIIISILFFSFKLILNLLSLEYRQWIIFIYGIVFVVSIILGIIQLIIKIPSKPNKIIIGIVLLVVIILSIPSILFCVVFSYTPEHVVTKNDVKLVGYVNGFLRTQVKYYDYKNYFVRGEQLRLYEDYGRGGFDPLENKNGCTYTIEDYIWYDDLGNPME